MAVKKQLVLYYPPGESMWWDEMRPNSEIAKRLLEKIETGADVILPKGWVLKDTDGKEVKSCNS